MSPTVEQLLRAKLVRPVDRHFAEAVARADEPLVGSLVALASRMLGEGHVCLPLSILSALEWPPEEPALPFPEESVLVAALGRSAAVEVRGKLPPGGSKGTLADALSVGELVDLRPLVLDTGGRLYLRRYFEHEAALAERLRQLLAARQEGDETGLEEFFPQATADPDQRAAARLALAGGLTVISGGPGTGKTSTVVRLLAVLARRAETRGSAFPKVLLLAPTGKAAARLSESIRSAKQGLALSAQLADAIPEVASTIHRALGVRAQSRTRFRRGAERPLDAEVIVVDEASMIDLSLMRHLLDAVGPGAQVVLLGDRDQLASVEAGSVLSELCEVLAQTPGSGGSPVGFVQLKKSYRFAAQSGIAEVAQAMRQGDGASTLRILRDGRADLTFLQAQDARSGRTLERPRALRRLLVDGFRLALSAETPADALREFEAFRVLCAHRRGPWGSEEINRWIEECLQDEGLIAGPSEFYAGRLILVTQNDASMGLSNGDVGLVWRRQTQDGARDASPTRSSGARPRSEGSVGAVAVHFPRAEGPPRAISPAELPAHETAFAMTIHKSQGSEYDHVCIVLPDASSRLLARELLYTAVTRARRQVTVFGSREAVATGVGQRVNRFSGLGARLG